MNIQDFCAKDDSRKYLKNPFIVDGKTVATNGHIMLILDELLECGNEEATNEVGNGVRSFMSHEFDEFYTLPSDIDFKAMMCPQCDGSGVSDYCPEREGDGVVYLGNDYCGACCGAGAKFTTGIVLLRDGMRRAFNPAYLRLISELEGVKVSPSLAHKEMMFVFNGGFGYVMPYRDEKRCEIKLDVELTPENS